MARQAIDLTGRVFGRLTVLERAGVRASTRGVRWLCRCDCGKTCAVDSAMLRTHQTRSCGCLRTLHVKTPQHRANMAKAMRDRHRRAAAMAAVFGGAPATTKPADIPPKEWTGAGDAIATLIEAFGMRPTVQPPYCAKDFWR